jgi:succinate-acetate transporter protein
LAQIGTVIPMALFYGGLAQFVAGIWEFRNNNTFGAVVFCSFGAFWGGTGFFFFFTPSLGVASTANQLPAVGFTLVGWTVFSLYMWVASIKVNKTVFIIFALLVITLILLDIGFLGEVPGLIVVGGYTGILISLAGWYLSAAGVINHVFGRVLLPIGGPFGEDG